MVDMAALQRTHLQTPLPGTAANVEHALGSLERGKPIALVKEGSYYYMLHV
jgi:hypothetical protein